MGHAAGWVDALGLELSGMNPAEFDSYIKGRDRQVARLLIGGGIPKIYEGMPAFPESQGRQSR
jgi:hypothetical protein